MSDQVGAGSYSFTNNTGTCGASKDSGFFEANIIFKLKNDPSCSAEFVALTGSLGATGYCDMGTQGWSAKSDSTLTANKTLWSGSQVVLNAIAAGEAAGAPPAHTYNQTTSLSLSFYLDPGEEIVFGGKIGGIATSVE